MNTLGKTSFVALLVAIVAAAPATAADKAKKIALEGHWKADKDVALVKYMKFTRNKYEVNIGGEVYKGTLKLNADKTPQQIDLTVTDGPKYKGKTALGIVKIRDGVLTWCSSQPGAKRRPSRFAEKIGDARFLLATFKKAKK